MKIGALARSLGVPVPTLRRWTQEFADGLSPEARGGDGRPRDFSPRDQRLLRQVKDLLADREMTYARARQRLREDGLLNGAAAPSEAAPAEAGPASEAEREAAERFVATIVERLLLPWTQRIEQAERQLEGLRQQIAALQAAIEASEATTSVARKRWPFG